MFLRSMWGVGGTVASESALRHTGAILSRVRAPPPAPWPNGGPESLRSPCYMCKNQTKPLLYVVFFRISIFTVLSHCPGARLHDNLLLAGIFIFP
ncbi:hypothetical protein PoB_004869100 [Plakobranchus ocellatus]|uniref:Secreted protein n=1 Tax=Plakobranchus ocellatus TaxID=259542 RepID=A0AAV4BSY2_9GAST|nr:hypothetical protein PoB_004869100 [Plakobranchus ocellatus]